MEMLEIILLSILVGVVGFIVYKEYQNTKKYNEERKKYKERNQPTSTTYTTPQTPIKKEKRPFKETPKTPKPSVTPVQEEKEIVQRTEEIKETIQEEVKRADLPVCDYPEFDHSRTVAMGLSEEEATEFMQELVSQIDTQIPLIEKQMEIGDFHQMERLTHSIKGSATNLGTGSVSDLLVDFNTYLKTGTDIQIATAYFEYLKVYAQKLKKQYC